MVVRNNVCHANQGGNADGIVSLSPLTAQGNVVYGVQGNGITFGTSGVILFNVVYNVPKAGIYSCDDPTYPVQTSIKSNTVCNCGAGLTLGDFSAASRFQVINNLIVHCSGDGMGGWLPSSGTGTFTIQYNDAFGNGGVNYGYPASYFGDATDRSVDPLFVNRNSPAGPDGTYHTADDGFVLQTTSPVAVAGEGGTYIGAYAPTGSNPPSYSPSAGAGTSGHGGGGCGLLGLELPLIRELSWSLRDKLHLVNVQLEHGHGGPTLVDPAHR